MILRALLTSYITKLERELSLARFELATLAAESPLWTRTYVYKRLELSVAINTLLVEILTAFVHKKEPPHA